jgi:hypothetical protein
MGGGGEIVLKFKVEGSRLKVFAIDDWGCELHTFNENLRRLSVAIFFASKAGKKGFPLLSASSSSVEYLFNFYYAID